MPGDAVHPTGIYYFLGNITSHITHALPLWQAIGGEVIVLSQAAAARLEPYGVPVRVVDDLPRRWRRTGPRWVRTDQYLHVPAAATRTLRFLEDNARVVGFYQLFDFGRRRLRGPRTVHLGHGNWIKPYFSSRNRVELLRQHDHVAAPGPYGRSVMEALGIESCRLRDLGVARSDEVVARKGPRVLTPELRRVVGDPGGARGFTYVPTFWGTSSVAGVGLRLVEQVRDDQVLLVRLHPQTPGHLVEAYRSRAAGRRNVHLVLDDAPGRGLLDVLAAADVVIGDVSSVMLEAILLDKPLVFVVDDSSIGMLTGEHPVSGVVDSSVLLRADDDLPSRLDAAVEGGIDSPAWQAAKERLFYHGDGTSVRHLQEFIESL